MKNKNGFISMSLVYSLLVLFLFLMMSIINCYLKKNTYLEALDSQVSKDISITKDAKSSLFSTILEDNLSIPSHTLNFTKISNNTIKNGNGLFYIEDKIKTDENNDGYGSKIYFFRGEVDNNYVVFAKEIKRNSSKQVNEQKNICWRILRTNEDVIFSFADQEGYWLGRYSASEEDIAYDYFQGQGFYTLHCQNPYRHMPLLTYTTNPTIINSDFYKKLELEELSVTVSSTSEVRVTNSRTGDMISLKNLPRLGALMINRKEITLDGENIVHLLDESVSTWKGFSVESGDMIRVTGATSPILNIRRYL